MKTKSFLFNKKTELFQTQSMFVTLLVKTSDLLIYLKSKDKITI